MAASFNVNYDFNQHPEQTAGNGHDKNVDLEAHTSIHFQKK